MSSSTKVHQRPGHFPRILAAFWTLVVFSIVATGIALAMNLFSDKSITTVQPFNTTQGGPEQQVENVPADDVSTVVDNPPTQTEPEIVAPVVVNYHGTWNAVVGFDPFTIPVEEGLYNGTMNIAGGPTTERPKDRAYALWVFPDLADAVGILAAVARDPIDKDVIALSVLAVYLDKPYIVRIAFTVNGGKSWCNRDVLPVAPKGDAGDVRILVDGNFITMYGQDARPGYYWWNDIVDRNALPCS